MTASSNCCPPSSPGAKGQTAEVAGVYGPSGYTLSWRTDQFFPRGRLPGNPGAPRRRRPAAVLHPRAGPVARYPRMHRRTDGSVLERQLHPPRLLPQRARPGQPAPVLNRRLGVSNATSRADNVVATAGDFLFWASRRGTQWRVQADSLDVIELERLFLPTLRRSTGFLRTITRRAAPVPDWLRERKLSAYIQVACLSAEPPARAVERPPLLERHPGGFDRRLGSRRCPRRLRMTLRLSAAAEPVYSANGTITHLPWKRQRRGGRSAGAIHRHRPHPATNAKATGTFVAKALAVMP